MRSWCSDLGLEPLEYSASADVPASAGATTRVRLHFPSPAYTLRSKSYIQFVRSLLSRPPALDGAQLQFRLGTAPPHLLCYWCEAPDHMLGYKGGALLVLTPLGLTESTRYLGYFVDASGSFVDQHARIRARVREDCAATRRGGRSVTDASTLLRGFAGGSTGFTAMGVPLPAAQCRPLEALVATTITNCGRCTSKVGGVQLREAAPVGSGSFSLSV